MGQRIVDYTKFVRISMRTMAMLPLFEISGPPCFQTSIKIVISRAYTTFVDFTAVYTFVFFVIDICIRKGPFLDALMPAVHTMIYFVNILILFYFQTSKKDLTKLLSDINSKFQYESLDGLTRLDMREYLKFSRKVCAGYTFACLVSVLHWTILPFLTEGERTLPISMWSPFDVKQSPIYELAYIWQVYAQIMVAMVGTTFDGFFMTGSTFICGQFDILCCSLRNLRFNALLKRKYPITSVVEVCDYDYTGVNRCTLPEDEKNAYFCGQVEVLDPVFKAILKGDITKVYKRKKNYKLIMNNNLNNEVIETIKDCVKIHQTTLNYCGQFKTFYGPMLMVKVLELTMLACFTMYSFIRKFELPTGEYFGLVLVELFVYCYFGYEVTMRSSNVGLAVCGGPWYLLGVPCLKTLMPLIVRSSKPVCFTGGIFYKLTMSTFVGVLKGSFSVYTLMKNMYEKKGTN